MERSIFSCCLKRRSAFTIWIICMTQLRVEKEDKGLSLDTPFISFFFSASTLRRLLTFKSLPKKCFAVQREELDLIWGKKRRIKRSVKGEDKNVIISSEHLIPPHANTTTHPGNRLGSQSNTLCLIPPLLSSNQDPNAFLTTLQNMFRSCFGTIFFACLS